MTVNELRKFATDMQMDVFKRVVRMDNAFFAKRTTGLPLPLTPTFGSMRKPVLKANR